MKNTNEWTNEYRVDVKKKKNVTDVDYCALLSMFHIFFHWVCAKLSVLYQYSNIERRSVCGFFACCFYCFVYRSFSCHCIDILRDKTSELYHLCSCGTTLPLLVTERLRNVECVVFVIVL